MWVFVGSFDELAAFAHRAGPDERDQVRGVDRALTRLCGLDELERHGHARGPRARTAGDLGPVSDGGEGRLDGVRGAQVDPVLGGVVVEREQLLEVVGDLRGGPGNVAP